MRSHEVELDADAGDGVDEASSSSASRRTDGDQVDFVVGFGLASAPSGPCKFSWTCSVCSSCMLFSVLAQVDA